MGKQKLDLNQGKVLKFKSPSRGAGPGDCIVCKTDVTVQSPPFPLGNGNIATIDMPGMARTSWAVVREVIDGDMLRVDFKASGLTLTMNISSILMFHIIGVKDIGPPEQLTPAKYEHAVEKYFAIKPPGETDN